MRALVFAAAMAVLVILLSISASAVADCGPAKELIRALLLQNFVPVEEFEQNHKPVVVFAGPAHDWVALEYEGEGVVCVAGEGRGFWLYRSIGL